MSLSCLRSMSPIHQKYLQNMGVGATLVCSLMVCNRLWGLIACHHYEPRFIQFDVRAACEALAEACAIRIAALESFAQSQSELVVRRIEQRLVEAVSRDGDWQTALFDGAQSLLLPLGVGGIAGPLSPPPQDASATSRISEQINGIRLCIFISGL